MGGGFSYPLQRGDLLQYSELKTEVKDFLDRTDMDTRIARWINHVRLKIAKKHNFDWLWTDSYLTTTEGTATYALPSDYLDHVEITIGKLKLKGYTQKDWDAQMLDDEDWTEDNSEPSEYVIRGQVIQLHPPPDDNSGSNYTLHLYYYAKPSDFSADADFDYMSSIYPYVIIHGTVLHAAIMLDDQDKVKMHGPLYAAELKEMLEKEKSKKFTDVSPVMRTFKDFETADFKKRFRVRS